MIYLYIYKLTHPNSEYIYVGKTSNPKRRLMEYRVYSKNYKTAVCRWFNKRMLEGQCPTMEIIEQVSDDQWQDRERYWIAYYRNLFGRNLVLNIRDGGEDPPKGTRLGQPVSEETRRHQSEGQRARFKRMPSPRKGAKFTQQQRENISKAHLGQKAWNKGKILSDEQMKNHLHRIRFQDQIIINRIYEMYWMDCVSIKTISDIYKSHTTTIGKIIRQERFFRYTGKLDIKRTKIHKLTKNIQGV